MEKRDIAKGLGIAALVALGAYYISRRRPVDDWPGPPVPPGPPPSDDVGRIQGYVKDAITGARIVDAQIYVDGAYHMHNWSDGSYRTDYISFGVHTITVKADDYQTGQFTVDLQEALINLDLALQPLDVAPGPWSEHVTVEDMEVDPPMAYLGETVQVKCYIRYVHPAPLPTTIYGTAFVDGEELHASWDIDFRNPTVAFRYTPSSIGEFTVRAQNKSATFKVAESVPAAYYSPWGGIRMPVPIRWHASDGEVYEYGRYGVSFRSRSLPAGILDGYPEWEPGVDVPLWKAHEERGITATLRVVPMRWTGQQAYWDSKEELAAALVRGTYPTFRYDAAGEPSPPNPRPMLDIAKPLAFWAKGFAWSTTYGALYQQVLQCPHCGYEARGPLQYHGHNRLPIMRTMIEHIEAQHPEYLTQPSHGRYVLQTCRRCGGTGLPGPFPCITCWGSGQAWYRELIWGLPEFQD